jgi:hypothetical protein
MIDGVIETSVCRTWLGEDGILRTVMSRGCRIDLESAQEIWDAHRRLLGSDRALSLVDIRGVAYSSRGARALLGGQAQEQLPIAMALLAASGVSKVIGSFFLGLSRPSFPTRLFVSEAEALEWLKGFR